jgi:hypothetical protein
MEKHEERKTDMMSGEKMKKKGEWRKRGGEKAPAT